jgi:hypothetical protein
MGYQNGIIAENNEAEVLPGIYRLPVAVRPYGKFTILQEPFYLDPLLNVSGYL